MLGGVVAAHCLGVCYPMLGGVVDTARIRPAEPASLPLFKMAFCTTVCGVKDRQLKPYKLYKKDLTPNAGH